MLNTACCRAPCMDAPAAGANLTPQFEFVGTVLAMQGRFCIYTTCVVTPGLLHRLLQQPSSCALAGLSAAAFHHPILHLQHPWLLPSRGVASHQAPASPQQQHPAGQPPHPTPPAAHAAGAGAAPLPPQAPGILGPLGRRHVWWQEALRNPFQFRFYNPTEELTPDPRAAKTRLKELQQGVRQVDASFDVSSFMVGARLAVWHVMHSVLNHDYDKLHPCVSAAVEEVVRSKLTGLPYHYVTPGHKAVVPCESCEVIVEVKCVLPGQWGLMPAHTLAQLDPQRAAWPEQHPPTPHSSGEGRGGPFWLVVEVLTAVDYRACTPDSNSPLLVVPGRALLHENNRSWDLASGTQLLRFYLARGPVLHHPGEAWAAEPWFVLAALSAVPLEVAELRWDQQAHPDHAGIAARLATAEEHLEEWANVDRS